MYEFKPNLLVYVFRRGKVDAARQDAAADRDVTVTVKGSDPSMRPWSAHESRLNSDPVFHMRQRHWEVRRTR